ncbi:MAG: hypothetical protein M1824_003121 [Vezdaea acicularis]|nr:MAG: hypothetical protein M1824_003121 [Vezdaea acicularis]
MDLLNSIRKEGSRGGRADFKWEDVQTSQHRENYLGHSLMAPVGRWQKNKDLSWYAKGDSSSEAQLAATKRAEEIRRIKEAEQDALSAALGFPVAPRSAGDASGANAIAVKKALKESGVDEAEAPQAPEEGAGKGLGFGTFEGEKTAAEEREELGPMGWDDSQTHGEAAPQAPAAIATTTNIPGHATHVAPAAVPTPAPSPEPDGAPAPVAATAAATAPARPTGAPRACTVVTKSVIASVVWSVGGNGTRGGGMIDGRTDEMIGGTIGERTGETTDETIEGSK